MILITLYNFQILWENYWYIPAIFQKVWQTRSEEAFPCLHDVWEVHLLHTDLETEQSITRWELYPTALQSVPTDSAESVLGSLLGSCVSSIQTEQVVSMGCETLGQASLFSDCWLYGPLPRSVTRTSVFPLRMKIPELFTPELEMACFPKDCLSLFFFSNLEKFSQLLVCWWKKATHLDAIINPELTHIVRLWVIIE